MNPTTILTPPICYSVQEFTFPSSSVMDVVISNSTLYVLYHDNEHSYLLAYDLDTRSKTEKMLSINLELVWRFDPTFSYFVYFSTENVSLVR